ncbi:hypothetical protein EOM82_09775, partial [bacterium]|nr:hypothetical protein [bacterium]
RGQAGEKLIFGSYNWTDLQEQYDPSFLMISADPDLIASFGREFDRLSKGEAGLQKLKDGNYHPWDLSLQGGNYSYELWFSPGREGDGVKARLASLINSAQTEIKVMIWDFTDKDLALALVRRARAGVKVTLLTDTWNFANENSVFVYLAQAKERYRLDNFEILLDQASGDRAKEQINDASLAEDFDPFLHLHVLMIDNRQVLFGTNNWSRAGSFYNDESIMVSDDPAFIGAFQDVFNWQYKGNLDFFEDL